MAHARSPAAPEMNCIRRSAANGIVLQEIVGSGDSIKSPLEAFPWLGRGEFHGFCASDHRVSCASHGSQRRAPVKRPPHISCIVILLCASALAAVAAGPDSAPPCGAGLRLTSEEISQRLAANNAKRARRLRDFEASRQYTLDYTGFPSSRSAEMKVKVNYHAPGTKEFTVLAESGSKLILTRVFHKLLESEQESSGDQKNRTEVALTSDNYSFALRGCEADGGRDLYVMEVEPLRETKFLYRGTIWIDAQDFAVTRVDATPARNPSFWTKRSQIHHQYQKIGEFYLPALNETVTDVRLGGKAVLTIRYQDYKLNQAGGNADGK
jgi:hypothetical protein